MNVAAWMATGQFVLDWFTGMLAIVAIVFSLAWMVGAAWHRWQYWRARRRVRMTVDIIRKYQGEE